MNHLKSYNVMPATILLLLLTVSTSAFAHELHVTNYAHQLTHIIYGFDHIPVMLATALIAVLFTMAAWFISLAYRTAKSEWLAAGGVSVIAACTVLVVTL